ncbi:hypothetical protein RDI58_029141 [Solanum bulbocastanum]|uniref:Uncharacterized protein n=1 Tax=Solanum bulbocastanum TaxID=147425 RepID=A0AAN8STU2_SOLBU
MAKENSSSEMELRAMNLLKGGDAKGVPEKEKEEIKKRKSIALDPEDQGRSVNVKRRKFIEVAPQKSKLKFAMMIEKRIPRNLSWKVLSSPNLTKVSEMLSATKVSNVSVTPFEKSTMNLNDLFDQDVVVNDESNGVEVASQLVESVPPMNNMNLIDEIRCISDGQKELGEDFQIHPFTCRVTSKQIDKSCYPEVENIVKEISHEIDGPAYYTSLHI